MKGEELLARTIDSSAWRALDDAKAEGKHFSWQHLIDESLEKATRYASALTAAGYALVPLEPTQAMLEAAQEGEDLVDGGFLDGDSFGPADIWRAMCAAYSTTGE